MSIRRLPGVLLYSFSQDLRGTVTPSVYLSHSGGQSSTANSARSEAPGFYLLRWTDSDEPETLPATWVQIHGFSDSKFLQQL